jgi:hypothetical protein
LRKNFNNKKKEKIKNNNCKKDKNPANFRKIIPYRTCREQINETSPNEGKHFIFQGKRRSLLFL